MFGYINFFEVCIKTPNINKTLIDKNKNNSGKIKIKLFSKKSKKFIKKIYAISDKVGFEPTIQ